MKWHTMRHTIFDFTVCKTFHLVVFRIRGSFFIFVESGCISTNMNVRYHTYIYFKRSSYCLSTDINFISLAFSSVKIYNFEWGIGKDTGRNPCHFNHTAGRKLDAATVI